MKPMPIIKKFQLPTIFFGLFFCFFSGCSWRSFNENPGAVHFEMNDIRNFNKAFLMMQEGNAADVLQKHYISQGSIGLRNFIKDRIQNSENLAEVVQGYPEIYAGLQGIDVKISQQLPIIRQDMEMLGSIYPPARFPDIYFVAGAFNSGGTISPAGLIIGTELFSLNENTRLEHLNQWQKQVLHEPEFLRYLVIHELVHYQQKMKVHNLLEACIMEGSADFITELVTGSHINVKVHEYAEEREYYLWKEFKTAMYSKDYHGWLYSSTENRPHDLGYWVGYEIAKAYYEQATEKEKAIFDILHIHNFDKFLTQSKYNGM